MLTATMDALKLAAMCYMNSKWGGNFSAEIEYILQVYIFVNT